MRYASIRSMDISNGEGVGVALFVQGCHFNCYNCFNKSTHDFCGGKEWTEEIENNFIELSNRHFIQRVSILGGEPLADENYKTVMELIKKIRKPIWLYTGYTFEECINTPKEEVIKYIDVLVDGKYIDHLKDFNLKFRGSSNQRVIDVKKSLSNNEVVLWNIK